MKQSRIKRLYAVLERRAPRWTLVNGGRYWTAYALFWRVARRKASEGVLGVHWEHEGEFLSVLRQHAASTMRALEIGCGGGRISAHAAVLVSTLRATDVSRGMIALAKRRLSAFPNVTTQLTDGFSLHDFADENFDLVFSHDVFVHFSSLQVYPYLQEIARVLVPGGKAVVSFYDFFSQFETFKRLSCVFTDAKQTPPHMRIHFVTEAQLRMMAGAAGLSVLEVRNGNFLVVVLERTWRQETE